MAELHIDQGISNQDEKYFIDKVEENVRRIEQWFLRVRNKCFERFEFVQNDLPKEIKSHLPCISEFTSFQQYTQRKQSISFNDSSRGRRGGSGRGSKSSKTRKKKKRKKKKHHRKLSSGDKSTQEEDEEEEEEDDDTISTGSGGRRRLHNKNKKRQQKDNQSITSSSTPGSSIKDKISPHGSNNSNDVQQENIINVKDRVQVTIDIQHNDQQQIDDNNNNNNNGNNDDDKEEDLEMNNYENDEDECPTPVSSSEAAYDDDDGTDDDDKKYGNNNNNNNDDQEPKYNIDDQDEESFNATYLRRNIDGEIISPPTTLFIENAVFSHLPPSAHRECLSILLTLGKLKLFAWQNSEGVRKIIKKYDKRFSKTLTSTLWPKIKLNEFVQETKNDSYIAQVAAVLCTRTIPFGHLDANDLREKGVNLKQMADSIQQLEQVVAEDDLKEVVPMNVEPRSYMANERTFLKWMRMSALTTLVGMILLAMKHEPVTGVLLIILSIFVLIRSYHEYYKRNEVLVNRIDYQWIDYLGARLLMLSLFIPMITYLVYLILYGSTTNIFHK